MAKKNDGSGNKKKKGNILPVLIIAIVAFLAYKANPEYWQQGKLFEDLKNAGKKEVKTEEVVKKPEPKKPEKDPDLIYDGSIKGSKTIPAYVRRAVNTYDPNYYTLRSKSKTIFLVYPEGAAANKTLTQISEAIENKGFTDIYRVDSILYTQKEKAKQCDLSVTQKFLCEQCDRKICIINPKKSEFMVIAPTSQAAIGKMTSLNKSGDWDK